MKATKTTIHELSPATLPTHDPTDLFSVSSGPFAGSITTALFLSRFVEMAKRWAHFDVDGWNPSTTPVNPEGGQVQMAHALFDLLALRYPSKVTA